MFRPGLDDLADVYGAGRGLLAVGLSPACTPELVDEILTAVGIRLLPLRPLAAGGPEPEPHRHDDAPDWRTFYDDDDDPSGCAARARPLAFKARTDPARAADKAREDG